jgi:hypothetical protein
MASACFNLTSDGWDGNHRFQLAVAVTQLPRQWHGDFLIDKIIGIDIDMDIDIAVAVEPDIDEGTVIQFPLWDSLGQSLQAPRRSEPGG